MSHEQLPHSKQRWQLIRDLVVFQVKLVIDGLKDLVLGPLSLVAGAIDIARATPREHSLFRALLRTGASFDRWVGLFDGAEQTGAHKQLPPPDDAVAERRVELTREPKLDGHLLRLEQLLIAQQRRGGLTAEARRAVDQALDLLEAGSERSSNASGQPSEPDSAAR